MIELKCNNCGRTVKVPEMLADKLQPDSPAGRVFKCPGCGQGLGGAERQTPVQPEVLKCAQCGRVVSDPAEFVRGKGLCAECGKSAQPAVEAQQPGESADVAGQQTQETEKQPEKFVPISAQIAKTAPWKNQPRRQMQPADKLKKSKKAGRETFLFWGLGGVVVLIVIGMIMHLFVFRDTWEEDNRGKAIEMRQEARALASRGAYEQATKKYQTLIDLLSSRRLQSSDLKDLLDRSRFEKADALKRFSEQQELARRHQEQVKQFLAGFEPKEQEAKDLAAAGQYKKAVQCFEKIIVAIEDRPDSSPEVMEVIARLNKQRMEVSQKLRDQQAQAATRKAQEDAEAARIAAEKAEEEKARLAAEQAKKEEEDRQARIAATQHASQNPPAQSSPAENPAELSRLRQSDIKAMKDSLRTIQDFVAAYRPVQRLTQSSGQADDLLVLAERVQQAGSMLFAPAFEQAPARQPQTFRNWRARCNQTASDALAACQTIQRNLDTICKLYRDMKVAGLTGDSGASLLKKLNEQNAAEWLKLQELSQQADDIVKGG